MDLINALYTLGLLFAALFILGILLEIWIWWYPGYVVRANRARRVARFRR